MIWDSTFDTYLLLVLPGTLLQLAKFFHELLVVSRWVCFYHYVDCFEINEIITPN